MKMRTMIFLMAGGLLVCTATVTASPPSGSTCVSGYNPSALTNVCYQDTPGTTINVPSVTTTSPGICPVGDICVPVPGLGPSHPESVPGALAPTYVEVDHKVVYSSDQDLGDVVGGAAQGALDCLTTPTTPVGPWASGYVGCVREG
jgi:hypothetical protein